MTAYYKATRPDGRSFMGDPKVSYLTQAGNLRKRVTPAPFNGEPILCGPGVLHVADAAAETLIGSWPCRLFRVEPIGDVIARSGHKFGFGGLRVVEELPSWQVFGPNGEAVVALIERAGRLTAEEAAAGDASRDAARDAAWGAARDAAWGAAGDAARYAAGGAALALVVRDRIPAEQFDVLYRPWAAMTGDAA